MYENLIIVFPPGSGGNHIANLIALSGKFSRAVDFDQYDSPSHTAHFSSIKNLNIDSKTWNDLRYKNNVLCCHLGEYLWNQELVESHLTNRKYMIVEMHKANESIRRRMQRYYPLHNTYQWEECSTLYSSKYFSLLTNEHDFFNIDVSLLTDANVDPLVDTLQIQLNINIDIDRARHIHKQWHHRNFGGTNEK